MSGSRTLAIVLGLTTSACVTGDDAPHGQTRALRYVPGLAATAVTERGGAGAEDRLGPPPEGCQSGDPTAFVLTAEVDARSPGPETIIASSTHGVVVMDADDHRLGARPFDCGGSGDAIVALAVGDAGVGTPVIVVVATTGGHHEATTRVEILGMRANGLDRLFAGDIETRDGDAVDSGELRVTADGLVHRRPDGKVTRWRADPWARTFTPAR